MVESLLEILAKKRSETFFNSIDVQSVTNTIREIDSSISMSVSYCESDN